MYTPTNKKVRGVIQKGGAYISSMADPSTFLISSISKETLSTIAWMANISSIANITSYDEISNLSISQISTLIGAVTKQISNEGENLTNTQSQIAAIQTQIDAIPDGDQAKYDRANEQYIEKTHAYELAQAKLAEDQRTLSLKITYLECLSSCSSFYLSSVEGYAREYSTIWDSIQANNDTMAEEDAEYQTRLREHIQYTTNYDIAIGNLESTLRALDFNSSMLSTATYYYYTTSTNYGLLLDDYINFSTNNLSVSQYFFFSTNKHLSGLVDLQSTQLGQYVSTYTARHLADGQVLLAQATLDYRNARTASINSIIDYNRTQKQLRNLLQGRPNVRGGQRDDTANIIEVQNGGTDTNMGLDYFQTQTPPVGQELAYHTLYLLLSTLSTGMFTASNKKDELEINQTDIQSVTLKEILDVADMNISQAQYIYHLAELNQSSVISTMSGLSTRIGIADIMEDNYLSTLSSLSTIYLNDISTYNGIQAAISTYDYTQSVLNGFLISTLLTLRMLNGISTMYNSSITGYSKSYIGYSTLEGIAQSSINGYSSIKGETLSTMNGLDGEIGGLNLEVGGQFTDLTTTAQTFYSNVKKDLNNELDAYKYGIQEWNSFIGYLASELLIQKLNLYTAIDSITFALQTNITIDQQGLLISQRNGYGTLQTTVQSVIDKFNVLDVQFANILTEVEHERTDKESFVNTRSILTDYEISVLKAPLPASQYSAVQGQYIEQMGNLNGRVNSINSHILHRNGMMIALYEIINPQLTIIGGLQILSYTLPDPIQTTIGPFNIDRLEYELLPQLNYGLSSAAYPLVLTYTHPGTITDLSIFPPGLFNTGNGEIPTTTHELIYD